MTLPDLVSFITKAGNSCLCHHHSALGHVSSSQHRKHRKQTQEWWKSPRASHLLCAQLTKPSEQHRLTEWLHRTPLSMAEPQPRETTPGTPNIPSCSLLGRWNIRHGFHQGSSWLSFPRNCSHLERAASRTRLWGDTFAKELYHRAAALKGLLEKGLFWGIARIQVAKVFITQLSANKEKAIPTSAHSQKPRIWSPVGNAQETQKAAWERGCSF